MQVRFRNWPSEHKRKVFVIQGKVGNGSRRLGEFQKGKYARVRRSFPAGAANSSRRSPPLGRQSAGSAKKPGRNGEGFVISPQADRKFKPSKAGPDS